MTVWQHYNLVVNLRKNVNMATLQNYRQNVNNNKSLTTLAYKLEKCQILQRCQVDQFGNIVIQINSEKITM